MTAPGASSPGSFDQALHSALADGLQSGKQPLDIIRDAAIAQHFSADQSEYLARVTVAIARAFGRAHGISLMGNAKALTRIVVASEVALREVHDLGRSTMHLPDLAKADGKTLQLRETLTEAKLAALLAASDRPDGAGARLVAWLRRARRRALGKIKVDWAFAMWTGKSKPKLSDKITKWLGLVGCAVPILFVLSIPFFWYFFWRSNVQGTVSASGHVMGTWTANVDSCQRDGDDRRGVLIFSGHDEVVNVIDSADTGVSVFVSEASPSNKLRKWDSQECKVLKGTVTIDYSTSINRIHPVNGSIDFDCTANINGSPEHVAGHVTFKNCS
jgi:hypothetical protein